METTKNLELNIHHCNQKINLASNTSTVTLTGFRYAGIMTDCNLHKNFKLGVIEHLCADVILGIDFRKQHQSITINYGGKDTPIKINNACAGTPICSLTKASVQYPSLFDNLSNDVKPIATKSIYYSKEDKKFIDKEINHLKRKEQ